MPKPVVYLAFANDLDDHLALLKEESRLLMQTLSPLHDRQVIETYRDESTSVGDLISSFSRFDHRLAIFHYGGHAGGSGLQLEEGAAQAEGLAKLISQQQQLQLVFLNGCSTAGQVIRLIELGVPAVIATSVPIQDPQAKDFSTWFYQALTVRKDIRGAFEFAVAALQTKYQLASVPALINYRGIKVGTQASDALPWGLYINEEKQASLRWQLPVAPIQRFLANPLSNYKPNDYLPKILGAMKRFDPALQSVIEDIQAGRKDKREVLPMIVQQLPWTIGAQLQKLISRTDGMRTPGRQRLQQTINTYVVAAQMLLYILVSQLWEEKRKSGITLQNGFGEELLNLDREGSRFFDYMDAFARVGSLFRKHNWQPFVSEFTTLFESLEQKNSFYQAYLLLESIREQLAGEQLDDAAAAQLCEEAENSLTIFLGTISFLINYKLVAVRDITVSSSRHQEVMYHHKLGNLNAADSAYLTLDSTPRPFRNHTESGAVLLTDRLESDKLERYLSLSPFIIDNNAFLDTRRESLDIFLFAYAVDEDFVYLNVNAHFEAAEQQEAQLIRTSYQEKLEIKDEVDFGWELNEPSFRIVRPYQLLREQFEDMKKDLTN